MVPYVVKLVVIDVPAREPEWRLELIVIDVPVRPISVGD